MPLSISHLKQDLAEIRTDMLRAITELLESVGNVHSATMPLCQKASSAALELQAKCWGPQWPMVRKGLVASHLFPAFEVLMSLCSAFLILVLDRDCPILGGFRSDLDALGVYGEATGSLLEDRKCPMGYEPRPSPDHNHHDDTY